MITVKNGTIVEIEFSCRGSGYSGKAAIDDDRVIFRASPSDLRGLKDGIIDGKPVIVTGVKRSDVISSLMVVTFEAKQ